MVLIKNILPFPSPVSTSPSFAVTRTKSLHPRTSHGEEVVPRIYEDCRRCPRTSRLCAARRSPVQLSGTFPRALRALFAPEGASRARLERQSREGSRARRRAAHRAPHLHSLPRPDGTPPPRRSPPQSSEIRQRPREQRKSPGPASRKAGGKHNAYEGRLRPHAIFLSSAFVADISFFFFLSFSFQGGGRVVLERSNSTEQKTQAREGVSFD